MTSPFLSSAPRPVLTRADGSPLRILVVDDEPSLTDLLRMALKYEGWEVETAGDGAGALAAARRFQPDLVILDIMLPDLDGLAVLARLRNRDAAIPVLFLTAKDALDDRIAGLTAGGDDYVTKPFSLEEVIARVRGLLRRSVLVNTEDTGPLVQVGDLILNEDSHEVERAGTPIDLTATEFELLRFLMRNPRRLLSKTQILDRVWNYEFEGRTSIVELYISYLRKKIDAGREPMIHTSRGVGYMIKPARIAE
ncbi:response regulator transcription factor [Mycetocola spongiae]|uniref:response regulator transcription factor n=1 Tax=Mycetocola spongiae TaxID=2859226 RepID=UPI001CF0D8A0|nr:response regulator transcription factor [Mycetocola spongiae]UCR88392.1 response regulator transcription factor [Mycetocola spongiae]